MANSPSGGGPTIFLNRDRAQGAEVAPPQRAGRAARFIHSSFGDQGIVIAIGAVGIAVAHAASILFVTPRVVGHAPSSFALAWLPTALLAGIAALAGLALARSRAALAEARDIGRYELVELLGRGGMGEVWRARHRMLARPAAIKFVRPEDLGHRGADSWKDALPRFEREARITAQLTSPHTIEIYDFGTTEEGALCYVMEYLDGLDLDSLVRTYGPLSPARVVYLLRQVCISLAEAHQAGLVHRDIKPANIYVCRKGLQYDFVKLLDFGLVAKVSETPEKGVVMGTPATLAPEVALGKTADARADLYSLGCVAYWMLTGRPVFEGRTPVEIIGQQIRTKPDPPSRHTREPLSRDLELLVLEALQKDPTKRIPSAHEMSRRLARCEVGPAWSPGQAMNWWTTRGNEAPQGSAPRPERADSVISAQWAQ